MPRNKHKHLLVKVFGSKHARGEKKGATLYYNCSKHFLPSAGIPAVDKHLVLFTAHFPSDLQTKLQDYKIHTVFSL